MGRMGGAEVGESWQSFLGQAEAARAAELAATARRETMAARKEAALSQAEEIMVRSGSSTDQAGPFKATQEQLSPYLPLGNLGEADTAGRSYGFARVFVERDIRSREVVTKGRFFKKVALVSEVSDKVSRFGVVLFAGMEDGSDTQWFDQAYWSIVQRGNETDEDMTKLEALLQQVLGVLPAASQTEATN